MHKLLHDLLCPAISRGCSASRKRRARGSQANRHSPAAAKQPQTNPSVQPLLRDLGQRATTLLLQPLPSWPQLPKSRLHGCWAPPAPFPAVRAFCPALHAWGQKRGTSGLHLPAGSITQQHQDPPAPRSLTASCPGTSLHPAHTHDLMVPASPEGLGSFFF